MTYNAGIPAAPDDPSVSQGQMLTNFTQLDTHFTIDHMPFTTIGADLGKHSKATLIEQGADPGTIANEIALYTKALAGVSTLYMQKEGAGTVIQMSAQDPTIAGEGRSFLPGGIILKWGTATINIAASPIVFGSGAFPNAVYSLVLTVGNSATASQQVVHTALGLAGFTGYGSANNLFCYYIAVGR